jgi:hypothetical protein
MIMEKLAEAIDDAYQAHIMALYKALADAMLAANGNEAEMSAAQSRFQHGLAFAAAVRARARAAAGL